jgi:hypothetical protein
VLEADMNAEHDALIKGIELASKLRRTRKRTAEELRKEMASAEDPECSDAAS